MNKWVDEMDDFEPLTELEPFFVFAALELGDPESRHWLMQNSLRLHDLFRQYHAGVQPPCQPNKAVVQYIIWYDRHHQKTTQLTHSKKTGKMRT